MTHSPIQYRLSLVTLMAYGCGAPRGALPAPERMTPAKVADFPGYTEGIAFDGHGAAYVSSGRNPQSAHAVYRLVPGASPERWFDLRVPNGHKVLADGSHVILGEGTVLHLTRDGRVLDSLSADKAGAPLRRPNDIALDGHGGFYFTDPGVGDTERRDGKVFYVNDKWTATLVADGFCYPNGLVVRSDGRLLYLDDSCDGRVYWLPILSPGRLGNREVLATVPDSTDAGLDGMTLDEAGRLYIAHNGVGRIEVFDAAGHLLTQYAAGNLLASNVAFGGPSLGDLYVTGSPGEKSGPGALFRLHLGVRGRGSMAVPAP